MHARLLTSESEIHEIAGQWNRLSRPIPFRSWHWLGPWWRQYGRGSQLFVVAVFDNSDELRGLAPWYVQDLHSLGRVVRLLGSGDACSDYLSLLAEPGHEAAVAESVADWLLEAECGQQPGDRRPCWDLLELSGVCTDDTMLGLLALHLSKAGYTIHARQAASCWRIPLPSTWQQYLSLLSKPNRRRMRWADQRLQQPDCVHHTAQGTSLEQAWQILVDLHQQRWQNRGEPGCFADPRFERFLLAATENMLAEDRTRLAWLEIQGQAVASMIAFVEDGVTYAYQTGIAHDLLHENPGWLIQAAAIQKAIEAGCRGFDLLRGDEPYKGHLRAEPQPTQDIRIVPRRVAPRLRHSAWLVGNALKQALKASLNVTGIW